MHAIKFFAIALTPSALIVTLAVLFGGGPPDCQKWWDADYTGTQRIDGRSVECFHGNVVRVR